MNASGDDGRVGYRRPPKETRFKPGTSGNPAGRPKGRRKLAADLRDELNEMIKIVEDGRELVVSKQRAVVKALVAGSLKGDLRAIITLFNSLGCQADEPDEAEDEIAAEDRDIVESFADRQQASDMADPAQSPPLRYPRLPNPDAASMASQRGRSYPERLRVLHEEVLQQHPWRVAGAAALRVASVFRDLGPGSQRDDASHY